MLKRFLIYIGFAVVFSLSFAAVPIFAAGLKDAFGNTLETVAGTGGAGYDTGVTEPESIISQVIKVVLGFFGIIFVILIIYGSYKYMMARGNEEEIKNAVGTIQKAIIGLLIVMSAYAISVFIIEQFV